MKLQNMLGIGVVGNFTGHLEQAGESADFIGIETDEEHAPKGLFPFFLPNHPTSTLATYPLSPISIRRTRDETNLQVEPEVALICDFVYEDEKVSKIIPTKFAAFNDCSIRQEEAKKISHKKHWGASSKGISPNLLTIDSFAKGGVLDRYKLASYLKRDGRLYEYGEDSLINSYNYFYDKLLNWICHKINTQCDGGPLECILELLKECEYPQQAIITIGATRYTEFGESTYLRKCDEIFVVLYPHDKYTTNDIEAKLTNGSYQTDDISALHQVVI